MRIYIYAAFVALILLGLGWGYSSAYKSGKDAVVTKLQEDKVEVLKDGAKIDERVLGSDDDGLLCLLLDNCPSDKPL